MNTKQAKDFLADQVGQQAALDRTPFSDLEKRMMYFTESDPTSCDDPISLNGEFEEKYDTAEYEAKVSRLLRRAYKRLKAENPIGKLQWDGAIAILERGDHYVLLLWRQASSAHDKTNDAGSKVVTFGGMFVAGFFIFIKLATDRRVPTWVLKSIGILVFALFLLTMFFLAQQGYRALRRRKSA